jgi:endonuclease/exonuclease/phosphatase family metal-dependent hydrolase
VKSTGLEARSGAPCYRERNVPEIRIQTWNCFGAAQSLRSVLAWRGVVDAHRLEHPTVKTAVHEADLVCMQEIFLGEAESFFDNLAHPHKTRDANARTFWPPTLAGSGLGIASRWPFRAQHSRPFSRPHAKSERFARKGILHVRVSESDDSPIAIDVLTTHMQSGYDGAARAVRERQLRELRRAIDDVGSPERAFLVCGDLNICGLAPRRSDEYAALRQALPEFVDLGAVDDAPTFHPDPLANELAHRFESLSPKQRVDYILFRPAATHGPRPATYERALLSRLDGHGPPTFASDHFAVRVTLRW